MDSKCKHGTPLQFKCMECWAEQNSNSSALSDRSSLPDGGENWFNAYQSVDDFLFEALGKDFPVGTDDIVKNTISAIKLYAERQRQ